jgi:arabinoxylan arabinofuranohydrolase
MIPSEGRALFVRPIDPETKLMKPADPNRFKSTGLPFTSMALMLGGGLLNAQTQINPPFSMIDMNIHPVDGRVYAFTGTDRKPYADQDDQQFHMPYWRIFSSSDLVNWEFESYIDPKSTYMGKSDVCWAGHGLMNNGKWYFFFSNEARDTGVVVSDSLKGPWNDPLKKPLLPATLTKTNEYDNCTFVDDDGKAYILFGVRRTSYHIAPLNADLLALKAPPRPIEILNVPPSSNQSDAPFMHKHDGKYYLSWRTSYGVSDNIYGPYTYLGEQTASGHLGFFDFNGQNFVHYTMLKREQGFRGRYRFATMAYVNYHADGRIAKMEPLIKSFGVGQYDAGWPRIEAEWFMATSKGPKKAEHPKEGFEVRNLRNGDFLRFPNVQNCLRDATVDITYSCANPKGGFISIRAYKENGPEIGRAEITPTGSWSEYKTVSIPLDDTVPPGTLSFTYVFQGDANQELIRVDAFKIGVAAKPKKVTEK